MKNRFLSMLIGAVLFVLSAAAENYPYRSDVLWVTVPDHADWLYKTGEKAKIEVQFYKYGIPQDGVEVLYELGGDMMPSDTKVKLIPTISKSASLLRSFNPIPSCLLILMNSGIRLRRKQPGSL